MKSVQSVQLNDIEVFKYFIGYLKGFKHFERSKIRASYQVPNDFYKNKKYEHPYELKAIIEKNGFKPYSGENKFVKRFIYKGENLKSVLSEFLFSVKKPTDVYLVRSNLFTRNDNKVSSLADKVEGIEEEELLNRFKVTKYEVLGRPTLYIHLKTNEPKKKRGFYVYSFVVIDNNNTVHVSVPFALASFKQFSKRTNNRSLIKKFDQYSKDGDSDDIMYYSHAIYDNENRKFKDIFEFGLDFYSEKVDEKDVINDYPIPSGRIFDNVTRGSLSPFSSSFNSFSSTESNNEIVFPISGNNDYYSSNNFSAINTINPIDPVGPYLVTTGINPSNSLSAINTVNPIDSILVATGINSNNGLSAINTVDPIDPVGPYLVTTGIDPSNSLGAINTVDSIDSIPVTSGIDPSNNLNVDMISSLSSLNYNQNQFNIPSSIESHTQRTLYTDLVMN
ncbi:hypothetical protein PIROE2DRAFT_61766 [Piromyces sp. E2]|nr:hypothetical protein PIROE2DRAFT_61766 [Piromyces sp. E2]|eukprot:OUM62612.1 hypothetical protein PIROE2DRAFT_61766 [Piromyces sp. E2]